MNNLGKKWSQNLAFLPEMCYTKFNIQGNRARPEKGTHHEGYFQKLNNAL